MIVYPLSLLQSGIVKPTIKILKTVDLDRLLVYFQALQRTRVYYLFIYLLTTFIKRLIHNLMCSEALYR